MKIELRGITKRLGAQTVIANLTATLEFSHTLALIGPSGGGKSTLLRLLAGLLTPDSGEIAFDGRVLPRDERGLRAHRAGLGIVFQAFNLFPHLSALENIRLPLARVHGLPEPEATARALAVLERFQLADHALKRPDALSGGQRQRVAIARAVATQPRCLLLDEPTSALDPEMTAEVLELLAELRAEGRSMILVTHTMGFARQAADLVAFVADGALREVGPPETLFTQSAHDSVRRFLAKVLRY
jgi:polar amino acid transport system ATP-binding protein